MLTHRLLLAAEAIWLRVLHRGHVNTWYDKDFANVHNIYYPITQDLKHCPLRGKDEIAHKSLKKSMKIYLQLVVIMGLELEWELYLVNKSPLKLATNILKKLKLLKLEINQHGYHLNLF